MQNCALHNASHLSMLPGSAIYSSRCDADKKRAAPPPVISVISNPLPLLPAVFSWPSRRPDLAIALLRAMPESTAYSPMSSLLGGFELSTAIRDGPPIRVGVGTGGDGSSEARPELSKPHDHAAIVAFLGDLLSKRISHQHSGIGIKVKS